MKIPDEFMASDRGGHPQTVQQQPQENHFRRGSLDIPKPVFKVWNVLLFHNHTLQFHGYYSMKNSSETLQNLLYFWNKKTQIIFFIFHFELLQICYSGCPGIC